MGRDNRRAGLSRKGWKRSRREDYQGPWRNLWLCLLSWLWWWFQRSIHLSKPINLNILNVCDWLQVDYTSIKSIFSENKSSYTRKKIELEYLQPRGSKILWVLKCYAPSIQRSIIIYFQNVNTPHSIIWR